MLVVFMFVSTSSTSFAEKNSSEKIKIEKVQTELTDEIILSLTGDDLETLYNLLVTYKEGNPNIKENELDDIARQYYIDTYNNSINEIKPFGYYDSLLESSTGMNSQEVALAQQYPSDLPAVYSSSKMANSEASNRYFSGAYLGNQDAFRHTAWNALLVQRFYRLGKGTVTLVMARTKMWTDAHEYGTPNDSGLSTSQFSQDRSMDLLNNAAGRLIGETYYNSSEYSILQRAQYYIDNGFCQKIKADNQMDYTFSQMKAISTWTLKGTNTVGKK